MERLKTTFALSAAKLGLKMLTQQKRKRFEESFEHPKESQKIALEKVLKTKDEPALFYEFTTGSTGPKKKIPFTRSSQLVIDKMFLLWARDIFENPVFKFEYGRFYMAVSPRIGGEQNDHREDSQFVSALSEYLMRPFLAVNTQNIQFKTGEEFYFYVAKELLKKKDLEILSLWSPTAFLALMKFIEENAAALKFDGDFNQAWPRLKLISCWTSAQSATSAQQLQNRFPKAHMQGKGLLSTEGPMTMPWTPAKGSVPLLEDTYYKFKNRNRDDLKIEDIKEGEIYEIVPSFQNGLIDYEINDEVLVTHFYKKTPVLEFVGRVNEASDLAGEKLSGRLLREIFSDKRLGSFIFFPVGNRYEVFWSGNTNLDSTFITESPSRYFESQLRNLYHYSLARELKQLEHVKATYSPNLSQSLRSFYSASGMVDGQIKETNISHDMKLKSFLEAQA